MELTLEGYGIKVKSFLILIESIEPENSLDIICLQYHIFLKDLPQTVFLIISKEVVIFFATTVRESFV